MKILFDIPSMKIGCVLLQAVYGGETAACSQVDTKHWFLAPTETMRVYEINKDQWEQLKAKLEKK